MFFYVCFNLPEPTVLIKLINYVDKRAKIDSTIESKIIHAITRATSSISYFKSQFKNYSHVKKDW